MAENIIDIVYDRIKFDKDKLESGELQRIEVDSFNLSDFWSQFGAAVQALSNEVTKIGFLCGKEPYPSTAEMSVLMQEVMQYYTVTRDLYLVLPHEVGAEVFKAVTSAMLAIMATLLDILHSLNELTEKGGKERLVLTGAFWDACNAVESLPRNNLTAVMKAVYAEAELAKDALDELTTGKNTGQATDSPSRVTSEHKHTDQEPKRKANSAAKPNLGLVEWVTKQLCWGRPANRKSLLEDIYSIQQLLAWSRDKRNNHLFVGLESLKTTCEQLKLDRKIVQLEKIKMVSDSEPEIINNTVLLFKVLLFNRKGTDKDVNSEEAGKYQAKLINKNNDKDNKTDERVEANDPVQLVGVSQGIINKENKVSAEGEENHPLNMSRFISLLIQHSRGVVTNQQTNKIKITLALTWNHMEDANRLQQLLPAEKLQRWAFCNTLIPVMDYVEAKKWVHCQLTAKRPVTAVALDKEINTVRNQLEECLARKNTEMTSKKKKSLNISKYEIMTKLSKLLVVKHIFSCNPPEPFFNPKTDINISDLAKRRATPSEEVSQHRVRVSTSESSVTMDDLPPPKS